MSLKVSLSDLGNRSLGFSIENLLLKPSTNTDSFHPNDQYISFRAV